jgi:hypothetical protein
VGTAEGTDLDICGSNDQISDTCDSDLQQLIDAWPSLPNEVKMAILDKVQSAVSYKDEYFGKPDGEAG